MAWLVKAGIPAPLEQAAWVLSLSSLTQKVPSFCSWQFEMKLSPFICKVEGTGQMARLVVYFCWLEYLLVYITVTVVTPSIFCISRHYQYIILSYQKKIRMQARWRNETNWMYYTREYNYSVTAMVLPLALNCQDLSNIFCKNTGPAKCKSQLKLNYIRYFLQ